MKIPMMDISFLTMTEIVFGSLKPERVYLLPVSFLIGCDIPDIFANEIKFKITQQVLVDVIIFYIIKGKRRRFSL